MQFHFRKVPGIFLLIIVILLVDCQRKTVPVSYTIIADGHYDGEFPYRNGSASLGEISRTIRKIYNVVYYRTYQFAENARISAADITSGKFRSAAMSVTISPQTTSASGTVILNDKNHIALLTCAHLFITPDTLITYFHSADQSISVFIRYFSVKEKQEIFVKDIPACGSFGVLAADDQNDIAIIGKHCEGVIGQVDVFSFPRGNARELDWGCFVYVLSYPLGTLMLTQGIVSNPHSDVSGTFLVNALVNKGSSGGIVLSVRDGVPNFELVGLIKSAFTSKGYILKPEKEVYEYSYNESLPYHGDLFVSNDEKINYGITPAVTMETIRSFYKKYRDDIVLAGYDLDGFFQ